MIVKYPGFYRTFYFTKHSVLNFRVEHFSFLHRTKPDIWKMHLSHTFYKENTYTMYTHAWNIHLSIDLFFCALRVCISQTKQTWLEEKLKSNQWNIISLVITSKETGMSRINPSGVKEDNTHARARTHAHTHTQ